MKHLILISTIISTVITTLDINAQKYSYWGFQVSPLAVINQKISSPFSSNKINKGFSVGLIADWLVKGDIGSIRIETNYIKSSIFYQDKTGKTIYNNLNALDIPISYRWTYLFYSHFNIYLGGGTQFIFDKNYKQNYYIMYGSDYELYSEKIKNPYFFGINVRHGMIEINKTVENSVRPLTFQVTIGKKFKLTGYK